MVLENTKKFKQSSKTQPAPNKQICSSAKPRFTRKLNTGLETIEIHREEVSGEVHNLMKVRLPRLRAVSGMICLCETQSSTLFEVKNS